MDAVLFVEYHETLNSDSNDRSRGKEDFRKQKAPLVMDYKQVICTIE